MYKREAINKVYEILRKNSVFTLKNKRYSIIPGKRDSKTNNVIWNCETTYNIPDIPSLLFYYDCFELHIFYKKDRQLFPDKTVTFFKHQLIERN